MVERGREQVEICLFTRRFDEFWACNFSVSYNVLIFFRQTQTGKRPGQEKKFLANTIFPCMTFIFQRALVIHDMWMTPILIVLRTQHWKIVETQYCLQPCDTYQDGRLILKSANSIGSWTHMDDASHHTQMRHFDCTHGWCKSTYFRISITKRYWVM